MLLSLELQDVFEGTRQIPPTLFPAGSITLIERFRSMKVIGSILIYGRLLRQECF